MSEQTRAWIYRVLLAAVVLAGIYGLIQDDQIAGWVALVGALVGNGLATANTSIKAPAPDVPEGEV